SCMRCPMWVIRLFLPMLTITCLFTAGCGIQTLSLHEPVDLFRASFREKLGAQSAFAKDFLACTMQAYDERTALAPETERAGSSSSVASSADDVKPDSSAVSPIRALIERVKAKRQIQADSLLVLEDLVQDWKDESHQRLDLNKLNKVVDMIQQWQDHLDFDEDDLAQDSSRFAQLLLAYNKAYFGDLQFAVEPNVSGVGIRAVTKVTSSGFTDRNGNSWIFPGLSLDVAKEAGKPFAVSAAPVDSQRISADLARVFLEAFFDAAFRVPAVQGATALHVEWKNSERPYPAFNADRPPISLDALARITRDALRAEAAVTSLVGKTVRGGSVFSIQNETVAATLETAAGVIAKKLVEHEGFCYYEVITAQERTAARSPSAQGLSIGPTTVIE
ncbi:MAG TPA: hypothetical protein VNI35_00120, partial [Nitrospira sp.]|nr:hypothetical protein [Nitrospira sp.]